MVITPRPFGQVLADAVNSLGRIWKTVLFPALAVSIPISVATAVVFRVTGGSSFLYLVLNTPEDLAGLPGDVFWELARPFYIALAIATVLQVLAGVFVALASHRAVAADLRGEHMKGGDVTRLALRRYPVGLGSTLLIVLTVAVLIGLGTTVWLMPAVSVGTPNLSSVFVALLLLVALLGPGIWVAVSVSMTTSAIAIEGQGVLGSIRRSMRLVKGRWWATAGFLLLVGLLGGIAIQLIQLVALPLATVEGGSGALTIASALGVLTQGLLVAAIAAMYTHWYIDLRARREGLTTSDLG
jgi:hypothetical protein